MDSSCRASCRTGSLDTVLWPLFRVGPAQRPDWPIGLVSGYQARPARSLLCYAVKGRRLATRVPGGTTARVPGVAAVWRERGRERSRRGCSSSTSPLLEGDREGRWPELHGQRRRPREGAEHAVAWSSGSCSLGGACRRGRCFAPPGRPGGDGGWR
jgi:hypothetical protein